MLTIDLAREALFKIGGLSVSPPTREISSGDRREVLEPRIMQVLVALSRRRGEVVSRSDLIASCWAGRTVGEDVIYRCIAAVRRLAETYGGFRVNTIARVGYQLDEFAAGRGPFQADRKTTLASICVLPFANLSGDADQDYFSDGICEDLISDLSKIDGLFVVGRNTAFTFKGRHVDLRRLARELDVSHLLEGSVRKSGDRVRIAAQLIDGATGGHIWAERYDRELTDIFAVQDEVARGIATALELTFRSGQARVVRQRGTSNAEAYEVYLMARQGYSRGNLGDAEAWESIADLCVRATELDPTYVDAWVLLSQARFVLENTFGGPADGYFSAAERAIAVGPNSADAHACWAAALRGRGRYEEALAELIIAQRLDPDAEYVNHLAGWIYYRLGHFYEASKCYERMMANNPSDDIELPQMLIELYSVLGDQAALRRAARIAVERSERAIAQDANNAFAMSVLVNGFAALGQREPAREWARRAIAADPGNIITRYNVACAMNAHLNDVEATIGLLKEVFADETPVASRLLSYAKDDPSLDLARADPRIQALIAEAEVRLPTRAVADAPSV